MSTFKHPVGPQSSRVYWRRRVVVALAALAVIAVIVLIIVRPGSSSGAPVTPSPIATTAAPKSAAPTATAKKAEATTAPKKNVIPTEAATADGQPCTAKVVAVQPMTDAQSYAADGQPRLSFTLTNTGKKSCTIDAGTAAQLYTVTSGTEVYWKSTDCQKNPVHTEILLQPGKTLTSSPVTWDRTRSDPATCDAKRPAVPAGGASYHLGVSVGGFTSSATAQFLLD